MASGGELEMTYDDREGDDELDVTRMRMRVMMR